MSCSHCERAVNDSVGKLTGVFQVNSDAKSNTVKVTFDENLVPVKKIEEAIDEEGYTVQGEANERSL
jgi:Copper chaperone